MSRSELLEVDTMALPRRIHVTIPHYLSGERSNSINLW